MGKRRRERDRPKAAPDALYHPNKRVFLSYASDDDEVVSGSTQRHDPTTHIQQADSSTSELSDDKQEVELGNEASRGNAKVSEREMSEEIHTLPKSTDSPIKPVSKWKLDSGRDEFTGQFLSLGGTYDDLAAEEEEVRGERDGYDSTTEEAMAYLEAVRLERQGLPDILTAAGQAYDPAESPRSDGYYNDDDLADSSLGDDEAVIGSTATDPSREDDPTDPQNVFTQSLKERFFSQRLQLRQHPTVEALTALGSVYPISFPKGNSKAYAEWHRLISSKPPRLAQLQSLEQQTVFNLLALLQKRFLVQGKNLKKTASCWIWSLLARLDVVGNMNNDQVYPLRELGKRAVFLQLSLSSPEVAAQLESLGQARSEEHSPTSSDEIPVEPNASPKALHESQVTENTKATLDMILVVVGDIFGQRDLLEFRKPWIAEEKLN